MFRQDFTADFDAVLAASDPFCLVRFGDGEVALIDGVAHKSADAWSTTGLTWLRGELVASLRHESPGYCVGVPTQCCLGSGVRIQPAIRVPMIRRTFSTLFLHANLSRAHELVQRFKGAIVVGSWFGDVRIPADGVSRPWDVDACVAELVTSKRDVLLAAGPCSNVIALRYWARVSDEDRRIVLDVGSMLDTVHGRKTRHFHDTMLEHRCDWTAKRKDDKRARAVTVPLQPRGREPVTRAPVAAVPKPPSPAFQERGRSKAQPLSNHTKIGKRP